MDYKTLGETAMPFYRAGRAGEPIPALVEGNEDFCRACYQYGVKVRLKAGE